MDDAPDNIAHGECGCNFTTWIITAVVLIILYWYYTNTFDHWKKLGVPYAQPTVLVGNIGRRVAFRTSFHEFQLDLYKQFKDERYAGFFEGRRPVLMVRDPDLIRNIMVRDFDHFVDRPTLKLKNSNSIKNMLINLKGSHWKAVRAQLTPTFSSGKMKIMGELIEQCGKQLGDYLRNRPEEDGNVLELKEFFGRFTMDVIASCAFGVQCDSLKNPDAEFVKKASKFNDLSIMDRILIFAVLLLAPSASRFIPLSFMHKPTVEFLEKVVQETKAHRLKDNKNRRNDFLQIMIDVASKEESQQNGEKPVMTESVLIAQALLFLIAGFETSSTLLTMSGYELALNPEIQDKLREEVTTVLDKYGGKCTLESLHDMTYLEMVLLETLRKHPPVSRVDRSVTKPYVLDSDGPSGGVHLDVNESVSIPIAGLQYDPQYYPEPYKFNPERFTTEEKEKRSPYVYLPFGAGPRNCIGSRFAMLSTKMAMANLIKDFKLEPNERTEVPFKYSKFSMLLKAHDGVWINVTPLKVLIQ